MRIWIDADAAPRDVKDIVFRASHRLSLPVTLVANRRMPLPLDNPLVTSVWVPGGPDEADRHIAEHAQPGDLAVTADIFNFLNLLDKDWGINRETATFQQVTLLQPSSYFTNGTASTADDKWNYTVPATLPFQRRVLVNSSRWRMQFGVKYIF